MASESDYIILDVRRPDEFATGHIPNAVNIPNESIGTDEIDELATRINLYRLEGRDRKVITSRMNNKNRDIL